MKTLRFNGQEGGAAMHCGVHRTGWRRPGHPLTSQSPTPSSKWPTNIGHHGCILDPSSGILLTMSLRAQRLCFKNYAERSRVLDRPQIDQVLILPSHCSIASKEAIEELKNPVVKTVPTMPWWCIDCLLTGDPAEKWNQFKQMMSKEKHKAYVEWQNNLNSKKDCFTHLQRKTQILDCKAEEVQRFVDSCNSKKFLSALKAVYALQTKHHTISLWGW